MKKIVLILCVILIVSLLSGCSNLFVEQTDARNFIAVQKEEKVNKKDKIEKLPQEEVLPETQDKKETLEDVKKQVEDAEKQVEDESMDKQEQMPVDEKTEEFVDAQEPTKFEENTSEDMTYSQEQDKTDDNNQDYCQKTLIASGSTTFNPNQINRSSNLRLAASYISGVVLKPDDEFSFNAIVGKRTTERGFLPADVFSGKTVVKGVGGGICQTSTTLCIAVKQTTMEILEQNPHSMRVSYASYEDEAMISYGSSDFRFVNTYDFPIIIEMHFEEASGSETIVCDIYALE